MKRFLHIVAVLFCFSLLAFEPAPKQTLELDYKWEDQFSNADEEKIKEWLGGVSDAVASTFGSYPFRVKLYIHRSDASEPVPWAETVRYGEQGVHFYVDPDYDLEDFQMDWTAAHELSHLSIPYVGRDNMWFSEGYASFWQWKVLKEQGIYSQKEIDKKYRAKLNRVIPGYDSDRTFLEVADQMRRQRNYPGLYWGGSCYFFEVDRMLKKEHNTSLREVIRTYQSRGRLADDSLEDLIKSLDDISRSKVFSKVLKKYTDGPAREAVNQDVLDLHF